MLNRARRRGLAIITGVVALLASIATAQGAHAATPVHGPSTTTRSAGSSGVLPAPPAPPKGLPTQRSGYTAPTSLVSPKTATTRLATVQAATVPTQAVTWGVTGAASTLVLYDSTGSWGWEGELYAIAAGNLASHFGKVTAEPVVDYVAGQVNAYTATIYLGSTYNEPLPTAFLDDVLATTHPVVWAADNVWQLSGTVGSTTDTAFMVRYGWDPSTSYFDTTDDITTVGYKGQTFTRNPLGGATVLAPHLTTPAAVSVLATANCATSTGTAAACAPIAQSGTTGFPWAIHSANLTYVGEIPLSYLGESDRYLVYADLLFAPLAPTATPRHQALVRLEDVGPDSDPTTLRQTVDYLYSQKVPFSIAVYPEFTDPQGVDSAGKPTTKTLAQVPAMVSALRYAQAHGGVLLIHGFTHQYSTIANPYDGKSGDDAEFYRAQCSTTQAAPYHFETPCQNTDWVTWEGPLPGDSATWAAGRVTSGLKLFTQAGFAAPTIWVTPQYAATAADYAGFASKFSTRYDREFFFGGQLTGQAPNYTRVYGQFFPYAVHDLYGTKIIPENLGDDEPTMVNNNPPRTPADIIHNAALNLALTQGFASFFIHPDYDPVSDVQQMVTGIKALGYTFVSPTAVS